MSIARCWKARSISIFVLDVIQNGKTGRFWSNENENIVLNNALFHFKNSFRDERNKTNDHCGNWNVNCALQSFLVSFESKLTVRKILASSGRIFRRMVFVVFVLLVI